MSREMKDKEVQLLQHHLWVALETQDYADLSIDGLAEAANIDKQKAYLIGGSLDRVLVSSIQEIDDSALAQSFDDFLDDAQASTHEKLLEGLIHRFECYAPKRAAMKSVARSALNRPSLAIMLAQALENYVDRLLMICGDQESGFRRQLRVKGVCGVLIKTSQTWHGDDSPDLSKTLKALDTDLKTATEWAVSLRLLSPEEADEGHRP